MANYILVMDQGTTGSRGVVYDEKGKTVAMKSMSSFSRIPAGGSRVERPCGKLH